MKARLLLLSFAVASMLGAVYKPPAEARTPQSATTQSPAGSPSATTQDAPEGARRGGEARGRGLFGKISAIQANSIEVTRPDGTKVAIRLTSSTEFRKERQPAKWTDFKVGDAVAVRISQDSGNAAGATALMVAGVPAGGFAGRGGGGGGQFLIEGAMGKDYVVGEVKSIDAPKLTILREDNVTQSLELNEDTSLRRGRDSITMADIQIGDHVLARGALANNVFVPKNVMVIPAEQWKRMQEMMNEGGEKRTAPQNPPAPPRPSPPPAAPTSPEMRN